MLTAAGEAPDGRKVAVIGLTYASMMSLAGGEPIVMQLDAFDASLPELTIMLLCGHSEEAMREQLAAMRAQAPPPVTDMRWNLADGLPPIDFPPP